MLSESGGWRAVANSPDVSCRARKCRQVAYVKRLLCLFPLQTDCYNVGNNSHTPKGCPNNFNTDPTSHTTLHKQFLWHLLFQEPSPAVEVRFKICYNVGNNSHTPKGCPNNLNTDPTSHTTLHKQFLWHLSLQEPSPAVEVRFKICYNVGNNSYAPQGCPNDFCGIYHERSPAVEVKIKRCALDLGILAGSG